MNLHRALSLALDPSLILRARGLAPDPWQREAFLAPDRQVLLNCSRQAGKSTVVSALALHTALFVPGALVLLLSPSQRQSAEIFRKVLDADNALGRPIPAVYRTQLRLELANRSRVLCLPGREETIRSFGGVNLLVLDEAARIPDDLYRSVRPMLAVSHGRLVALSTPFGQRGWFHHEWVSDGPWKRIHITWRDCPRITPDFIAEETRALGEAWVRQEYEAQFTSLEGLVYPDFEQALVSACPVVTGKGLGGIDFGWRNPFAAIWGTLDGDDVLWLQGERYLCQVPLHEHTAALRRIPSTVWYADPAGATEIAEMCAAGLVVRPAENDIRPGIAAVTARLRTGRLKVVRAGCPHLLAEARLYRYPTEAERKLRGENPVDEHNHALGALRYLIAGLDAHFLARLRRAPRPRPPSRRHRGRASTMTTCGTSLFMIRNLFQLLSRWLGPRAERAPSVLTGGQWPGPSYVDIYRRQRAPTPLELLDELKNTAWACASLNAATCASFPPRLFVVTRPGQSAPRCLTRALSGRDELRLRTHVHTRSAERIEEVTEHPLLELLRQANPVHNAFDLWEITTLYQEVLGATFWYVQHGPLGVPSAIWPLPSHNVTPMRKPDSPNLVDYYLYRVAGNEQRFRPEDVIHFRYPDPRDPYTAGLSPLRACWEQVSLTSEFAAFKRAKFENHAIPDALVCPDQIIGEEERDRLETQWNQRLRRGGTGRVVVTEASMKVQLLAHSMGDLAALADLKATKEDVANAFHVPLSFLTSETNLANLQAAEHQHMSKAIVPRLRRRDEKLNEQLVPRFDPTGRLFLVSDDPVPINRELSALENELYLKFGVVTVNEVRSDLGLPPVPWGDKPFAPLPSPIINPHAST